MSEGTCVEPSDKSKVKSNGTYVEPLHGSIRTSRTERPSMGISGNGSKLTTSDRTCVELSESSQEGSHEKLNVDSNCNSTNINLDDLDSPYVITSATSSGTSPVIVLSVRKRSSLYNKNSIIWDTAASVHIIRNAELFKGTPTPVNDYDVSFVGFDTSSGSSFPVSRGTLLHPFEGIEAYYSPNCIGNIISEAKFRSEFHVEDKRHTNYKLDTMVTYRKRAMGPYSRIVWARGAEDIFICDTSNLLRVETVASVISSTVSFKLSETEVFVEDWLRKLGLTNQEALGSLLLSRVNSPMRRKVISACFGRQNMTSEQIHRAFGFYTLTSVKARSPKPPVVEDFTLMINSLRAMSIDDLMTTSKKRGRIDDATGDSASDVKPLMSSGTDNNSDVNLRLKPRLGLDVTVCTSCEAEPYALIPSSVSNIGSDDCGHSPTESMYKSSTMATVHTAVESSLKRVTISVNPVTADGLNTSKIEVAHPNSSLSDDAKISESTSSTTVVDNNEIHRRQDTTESNVDTLDTEGTLSALWLWNSKLSPQEVLVSLLISEVGLAHESNLVLLSLEQQGLSKAAIQRIGLVERWHKMTSFVGLKTLSLMIKNGTVKDLQGLSVQDVKNYHQYVHETDCACILGKMRAHSAPDFDNVLHSPDALFCDVMQLTTADKVIKYRFLIAIDAHSQFIFCIHLAKLDNHELTKAFKKLIGRYRAKSSKTVLKQIILDNAGSLKSEVSKDFLLACNLEPIYVTPAEHVKIAEAGIRVIKSLVRTTVLDSSTSKKFVTMFVPYLLDWVVGSINYSLRTGNDHISPYTRFTGKMVSANIQFRAAFLDIVAVKDIQDKSDNLDSRARIGMVLARDESERGALLLLDISSGQLMKRTHFHISDGPSFQDKVTSFLSSGKFRQMKIFDVEKLEKFYGPSEDFDIDMNAYKTAVAFTDSLEFVDNNVNDVMAEQHNLLAGGSNANTDMDLSTNSEDNITSSSAHTDFAMVVQGPAVTIQQTKSRRTLLPKSIFKISTDDAFPIQMPKDGACLLHSISWFFAENTGHSAIELRDRLCNYIQCNAFEQLDSNISIFEVIKAGLDSDLAEILNDESIVNDYLSKLRRENTWCDNIEIEVLSKILNITIVVFQSKGNFYVPVSVSGGKVHNTKLSVVPLYRIHNNHYESLNIVHPVHRDALKTWLSIPDEEGDVSLPHFQYSKVFSNHREVVMSVTTPPNIPNNNLNSNMCVDELEDDYKIRKLFCLLTIDEPSDQPSEGVSSLKSRRPEELVQAQQKEVNQVHEKDVWQLVFPKDITEEMLDKLIPLIMLNKEKCFSDGSFDKVKARLVALGCRQQLMEDELKEAPTASIQSFYMIIMLAAKLKIKLRSKDVTGAFLHADLQEEEKEYVLISKKHVDLLLRKHKEVAKYVRKNGSIIALLKKCLYGLKQSPQRWYDTIRAILEGIGMQATSGDKCLFYETKNGMKNYLLLFVDDMLIAFQSEELLQRLSEALIEAFGEITDQVGPVLSFLGITITQSDEEITLDQAGYINKLVGSLRLSKIPHYSNPAASNFSVYQERFHRPQSEADPQRLTLMRRLTMSVMYCALRTRRDVLFLSSFLASIKCPEKEDIEAIQRVIVYLANTVTKKQHFYSAGGIEIILFGDASHNAFVDGRGQSCEIIYADRTSAALDMNSSKQKYVTDSSCESEVIVQSNLGQHGIYFYNQLTQLGIDVPLPMLMYCDNEAAVTLADRKEINVLGRTKYFNRLIWKIHEAVSDNMVKPTWIASGDMDADMGTKALMGSNFDRVSNRSFSRMNENFGVKGSEINDLWRKDTVVKGLSETETPKRAHNSSIHGGSACYNDNQLSSAMSEQRTVSISSNSPVKPVSTASSKGEYNSEKSKKTGR